MNPDTPDETTPADPTAPAGTSPESAEPAHVPTGADYVSDRAFADFPVREDTLRGVLDMGFTMSTPVQAQTIEPMLAGADVLVRAKTGTGKTAAFGIPIVDRTPDGFRKPYALILEPTRELAIQTAQQLEAIATYRDVAVLTLVGGVAMGPQEQALAQGAEILVGTPGRILDHMRRKNLDPSAIGIVCLDEADEMLSMGFYEDVTTILDATPAGRQVALFSATISEETQRIVQRYLRDPLEIYVSTDIEGAVGIEHVIYETSPDLHKARALLYLLDAEDPTSAIIFCNTREDAATVATFLDRQGLDAQLISGELTQARRNAVMARVKAGEVRFLVATDVASRGIDISDLSHVVNYSLPQDPAVYLHRSGRTGRIGKRGKAISLVGGADLNTRRALESRHKVVFDVKKLPDAEVAVQMRVERQARQIRQAMGSLVFESYLPTVRALLQRDDGPMLLAAALRAFFQWDRERRARAAGLATIGEALAEGRGEPAPGGDREKRRDRPEKGHDRTEKGQGRHDRGDRQERGDRHDKGGRADKPREARREAPKPAIEDLDALLSFDTTDAEAPAVEAAIAEAPVAGDESPKKKKRRRRKKKKGGTGAPGAVEATGAEGDDDEDDGDDDGDDSGESAPAPAPAPASALDDLDALLALD